MTHQRRLACHDKAALLLNHPYIIHIVSSEQCYDVDILKMLVLFLLVFCLLLGISIKLLIIMSMVVIIKHCKTHYQINYAFFDIKKSKSTHALDNQTSLVSAR